MKPIVIFHLRWGLLPQLHGRHHGPSSRLWIVNVCGMTPEHGGFFLDLTSLPTTRVVVHYLCRVLWFTTFRWVRTREGQRIMVLFTVREPAILKNILLIDVEKYKSYFLGVIDRRRNDPI